MHYLLLEAPNEFSSLKKLVMIIILTFGSIEKIRSFFLIVAGKDFNLGDISSSKRGIFPLS